MKKQATNPTLGAIKYELNKIVGDLQFLADVTKGDLKLSPAWVRKQITTRVKYLKNLDGRLADMESAIAEYAQKRRDQLLK